MRKPDLLLSSAPSLPRRRVAGGLVAGALAPWWAVSGAVPMNALAQSVGSGRPRCAVLYPDIGEPFRSVFLQMAQGIDQRSAQPSLVWALPANTPVAQVLDRLKREHVSAVIALGRSGLKLGRELMSAYPVVVGGVVSVSGADVQGLAVHSLVPDPSLLFARLRVFMPSIRRVVVVHDPRQNAWMIQLARDAARQHGLELVAHEAADLKTAVRTYQDLLPTIHGRIDVIWLPQDTVTADDAAILPMLLRESWAQRFAIIASGLPPVRRGALLAMYPDNVEVGHELARLAQQASGTQALASGIHPLRQLRTAINTRTARHLGLDISALSQRIDLVLPES
jgi:putative ABC transport system substrate-binding protein